MRWMDLEYQFSKDSHCAGSTFPIDPMPVAAYNSDSDICGDSSAEWCVIYLIYPSKLR